MLTVVQGQKKSLTVTIKNTNSNPTALLSASLSDTKFYITSSTCSNKSIPSNGSCSLTLNFSSVGKSQQPFESILNFGPSSSIPVRIEVVAATGGGGGSALVKMYDGSTLISSPPDYTIGSVSGTAKISKVITIKNEGTGSSLIGDATLSSADFYLSSNGCVSKSLSSGSSCSVTVNFSAVGKSVGSTRSSTLSFGGGQVSISASVVSPPAPPPAQLVFMDGANNLSQDLHLGPYSANVTLSKTLSVKNIGGTSSSTLSLQLLNNASGYYTTGNSCSNVSLAPGASCSFSLKVSTTNKPAGINAVTLKMDQTTQVVDFEKTFPLYTLAISASSNVVISDGGSIYCGASCASQIQGGTSVVLTATPSSGYRISSWSIPPTCSVIDERNISCYLTSNLTVSPPVLTCDTGYSLQAGSCVSAPLYGFEPFILSSSSSLAVQNKSVYFNWGGYSYQGKRLFLGADSSYNQNQLFLVDTSNNEIKSMTLTNFGGGDIFNFGRMQWINNGKLLITGWSTYQTVLFDFHSPINQDPSLLNYDCTQGYNPCILSDGMFSSLMNLRTLSNHGTKIIALNIATQQNLNASSVFIYDTALPISTSSGVQNTAGTGSLYPPIYQECSAGGNPCYVLLPANVIIKDMEFNRPLISGNDVYLEATQCAVAKVILGGGSYSSMNSGCSGSYNYYKVSLVDFSITNLGTLSIPHRFFTLDNQLFSFVNPSAYPVSSIEPLTLGSSPLMIPGLSIPYNYFEIVGDCYHALCNNKAVAGNGKSIFSAMDAGSSVSILKDGSNYSVMDFNPLASDTFVEDTKVFGNKIAIMSGAGSTGSSIRGSGSIWIFDTDLPYSASGDPLCGQGQNPCVLGVSSSEILKADLKDLRQDVDGSFYINAIVKDSSRWRKEIFKFSSTGVFVKKYNLEAPPGFSLSKKVCLIYFEGEGDPSNNWADNVSEDNYPINSAADCEDAVISYYWGADPIDSGYLFTYVYQEQTQVAEEFDASFINFSSSKVIGLGTSARSVIGDITFSIDRGSGPEPVVVHMPDHQVEFYSDIDPLEGRQTDK